MLALLLAFAAGSFADDAAEIAKRHSMVRVAHDNAVDEGRVRFRVAAFDPVRDGLPDLTQRIPDGPPLRALSGSRAPLWIQYDSPWTPERRQELERAGVRFLGAIPNNAAIVRLPNGMDHNALHTRPGVRFVADFSAELKFGDDLEELLRLGSAESAIQLDVSLFADATPKAILDAIATAFDRALVTHVESAAPYRIRLRIPTDRLNRLIAALARDPDVQFVELVYDAKLHNDQSAWIVQSYDRVNGPLEAIEASPRPYAQSATIWNKGLHGEGQIVAVADTGFETGTCFFNDISHGVSPQTVFPPGALATDPLHRKIVALNGITPTAYTSDDAFRHGSHVAATLAGDDLTNLVGPGSAGHDHGDGIAPAARLILEDISVAVDSNCGVSIGIVSVEDLLQQQYDAGARISNNSWGTSSPTYSFTEERIDRSVRNNEDFLVVFSSGNDGTTGINGPAQCKNCVVVGATENWNTDFMDVFGGLDPENMTRLSSVGPASDGRMRPDVVAPGYFVYSNRFPNQYISDENDPMCVGDPAEVCVTGFGGCYVIDTAATCGVELLLGTSMSTPIVSGLGALTRQYFVDGFYPTGVATPADSYNPSAALMKAILINSARNLTGRKMERRGTPADHGALPDAPSIIQGWGRPVLDDALFFAGDSRRLRLIDIPNSQGLTTGTFHRSTHRVISSGQPLKMTLVWTDPPGVPAAGAALINNLDLVVTGPHGTLYRGNRWTVDDIHTVGDVRSLAYAAGSDAVNNVEGLWLPSPAAGNYTVTVVGASVPGDLDSMTQGYALVITGAVGDPTAPPVPDGTVGTPLLADRADVSGSSIDVTYDSSTCGAARFHLLYGDLSSVGVPTVDGSLCDLGPSGERTWNDVAAGNLWFLVVSGTVEGLEGRWGARSDGSPRDGGVPSGHCASVQIDTATTCP